MDLGAKSGHPRQSVSKYFSTRNHIGPLLSGLFESFALMSYAYVSLDIVINLGARRTFWFINHSNYLLANVFISSGYTIIWREFVYHTYFYVSLDIVMTIVYLSN